MTSLCWSWQVRTTRRTAARRRSRAERCGSDRRGATPARGSWASDSRMASLRRKPGRDKRRRRRRVERRILQRGVGEQGQKESEVLLDGTSKWEFDNWYLSPPTTLGPSNCTYYPLSFFVFCTTLWNFLSICFSNLSLWHLWVIYCCCCLPATLLQGSKNGRLIPRVTPKPGKKNCPQRAT